MDKNFKPLAESAVFSLLDANSGYWKVELKNGDRYGAEFTFHDGLYCFVQMTFGSWKALSVFQRATDAALSKVKLHIVMVYLDDTVVFARSAAEHIDDARHVSALLSNEIITLKLKSCISCTEKIYYLGHVTDSSCLEIAAHTTDALK